MGGKSMIIKSGGADTFSERGEAFPRLIPSFFCDSCDLKLFVYFLYKAAGLNMLDAVFQHSMGTR
jgi:hypothetical protein